MYKLFALFLRLYKRATRFFAQISFNATQSDKRIPAQGKYERLTTQKK